MAAATSWKLSSSTPYRPTTVSLSWRLPAHSRFNPIFFPKRYANTRPFTPMAALDMKPTILVAEKLSQPAIELLRRFANVDCSYDLSSEELCAKVSLCDALIVRSGTKVSREVFDSSSGRLKVVGRAGVGIDNVDLSAAAKHGCVVVNATTSNTIAAAEHSIALLLAMCRKIPQANASLKSGKWERSKFIGASMAGKTLAVIGFGKVGSEVARRAKGLRMHVIAHDPYAPEERARAVGVRLVTFDDAISCSDFISLHMPLTPNTFHLFDGAAFSRMRRGVRIVNVARGGVIDEEALVRALDSGIVAQAALDVFTEEPPQADHRLVHHENVIATPHLGATTMEAQEGEAIQIAETVISALNGELAGNAVNAPVVPPEVLSELVPYLGLAEKLGKLSLQLSSGLKAVKVSYGSARNPDHLRAQLLRAMLIKGLVEPVSGLLVNLVNADFIAKQRELKLTEEYIALDGSPEHPFEFIQVQIGNLENKFAGAIADHGEIKVEGRLKCGEPRLTRVGPLRVDVGLEGCLILCRQVDKPGTIGKVGTILGDDDVNVSFMNVQRTGPQKQSAMIICVDEEPSSKALTKIGDIPAIEDSIFIKL